MEAIVYLDEPAVPFSIDKIVAEVTPIVAIHSVIFNDPATIVLWANGQKTVVKTQKGEKFDPEKGLAMALVKYFLGNKGSYYEVFKECGAVEKDEERTPSAAHAVPLPLGGRLGLENENPSAAEAARGWATSGPDKQGAARGRATGDPDKQGAPRGWPCAWSEPDDDFDEDTF